MSRTEPAFRGLMSGGIGMAVNVVSACVVVLLAAPLLVVIVLSFSSGASLGFPPPGFSLRWYWRFFDQDPTWLRATWVSLRTGLGAAAIATALGSLAALGLARPSVRGRQAMEWLLLLPMMVPGIIAAVAFYKLFASLRMIGAPVTLMLAHACLALPYVCLNVGVAARGFDRRLEQAAFGLGASPWQAFRRVLLPILAPSIVASAFLAFVTSFDEVVVSLFLSGTDPTLQKRMWDDVVMEISPAVAAASTLLMAVTLCLFLVWIWVQRLLARRTRGVG